MIRKFSRELLESEPHDVLFADLYPWDAIEDTPFGSSLAIVQPNGRTMLHSHDPAETFIICRGHGTIAINGQSDTVGPGDVIYLPPRSVHDLRNDSATEDLVFVSVFWKAPVDTALRPVPRQIIPSPKTPNGPLHLGHLAGPYLLADAMRRYYRSHGVPAQLVCLVDDHQSYVVFRAKADGATPLDTATRFGSDVLATLAAFDATPDVFVGPANDAAYREAIRARFSRLVADGKLVEREVDTLHCETCDLDLHDVYVFGTCPACKAQMSGAFCETCNAPCDASQLVDPRCDTCEGSPVVRRARRFVFPIRPYAEALSDYHHRSRLSPKLRRLAAQWLDQDFAPAATEGGTWGISVGDGQVISPWFEVSLAASYLRETHAPRGEVSCFFGYDNAYLYLVQDPAVTLALEANAVLPSELAANEFLRRDTEKMSTSRGHALDAATLLSRVPADLLRLYLARVRPEDEPATANIELAQMFLTTITRVWQRWLSRLGHALAHETGNVAPAPSNPSLAPWSHEQMQFDSALRAIVARARRGYDACSIKEVMNALQELVDRATSFGAAQSHLAGVASLVGQRATGLALELAAARAFAMIVAPIMPAFGARLWSCLGETGAITWSDDAMPLPPGRAVTLANETFFPSTIDLIGGANA